MVRHVRLGLVVGLLSCLTACKAQGPLPKSVVLNDFERVPDPGLLKTQFDPVEAIKHPTYPAHDFDVITQGYAAVTPLTKDAARAARDKPVYFFIQGKCAAMVRFTVPADYHVKTDDPYPATWLTGFGMDTASHTPLKVTDWSPYHYFDFVVYNPKSLAQHLNVRFADAASNVTVTSVTVAPGEWEVEIPLSQLYDARMDASNIRGFMLYLDTAGQSVDPALLFDQIALYDTDAATRVKLALEEGDTESTDDEDWDSEDEDTVRKINVLHPGDVPAAATATAQSVSAPAGSL